MADPLDPVLIVRLQRLRERLSEIDRRPRRDLSFSRDVIQLAVDAHELFEICSRAGRRYQPDAEIIEARRRSHADYPSVDFFIDMRVIRSFLDAMDDFGRDEPHAFTDVMIDGLS